MTHAMISNIHHCPRGTRYGRMCSIGRLESFPIMRSKKTLIWLVPILTTVHNFEEAVFMPMVLARRNAAIPSFTRGLLPPITYGQFLLALFTMTVIPYLIAWL